ncbi:MAG TPA: hypothetical protein VHE81_15525, partial [Lacipirellulaceae bacterium]|nr:hypothetical protein [Lacipirellulaceae bacterium]
NGPFDQLNCNQLDIHFTTKVSPDGKPEPIVVDPAKRQLQDLARLEASLIVARGHPAVAVSPSHQAQARGDRIQIALGERRIRIDGGSDVMISSGTNAIQAPVIDYQRPEPDSASQIGQFRATGPGSLHFVPDPKKPDQVFQAAWQTSVQLGREKGQPVVVMDGRSELAFAAMGSLVGDQIRLYLRELDANSPVGFKLASGDNDQKQSKLAPDRLIAFRNVQITTPQLTGSTHQLVTNFRIQPAAAGNADNAGAATSNRRNSGGLAANSNAAPGTDPSQPSYHLDADKMQLDAFLKGQTTVPSTLTCDGHIVLREVPLTSSEQQPLEVHGEQLFVDQLDTSAPHVVLKGAHAGDSPLAQLSARGVTLHTKTVQMDGRDNRMWSDGPGEATMLMARDLAGNATATPTPVTIRWQGGLQFDGRVVTFDRNIAVSSADTTLHCDRMLATLLTPIKFGQHIEQTATSLSQIDCLGQVNIENLSRDTGGLTSHDRIQLGRLSINQQTGAVYGEGPGVIRSTRFGAGLGTIDDNAAPKPHAEASPPPGASGTKLHFLRVDFHTGLEGNLYTREVTFHDRVRALYGPVDSWEQELDLTRPELLPPESMTLTSDALRVNEDPLSDQTAPNPSTGGSKPMGPLQLQATGDVRIEGQTVAQGKFTIQADRASYDQAKDLFLLEGDPRTPAKLWLPNRQGIAERPLESTKIYYDRKNNSPSLRGFQYLEISPGDIERAQRTTTTRAVK